MLDPKKKRSETPDTLSLIEYDRIGIEEHFCFLLFSIERQFRSVPLRIISLSKK